MNDQERKETRQNGLSSPAFRAKVAADIGAQIAEQRTAAGMTPEQLEPRLLKQAMLEHYEEVAAAFHRAVFPKIAEANGLSFSAVPDDITPEMMRTVCVTESLFNTMVET